MSGPPRGTSSGAAETGEEALVVGDDAGDVLGLRGRVPHVAFERAAEEDAVRAGEHVAEAPLCGVADLGLRLEDGELAADRMQVLVAEQVAATEAGAVEHQAFGKRGDIGGRRELAYLDPAAGNQNVAGHLAEVAAGLDIHRVVAANAVERERVLGPTEDAVDRRE